MESFDIYFHDNNESIISKGFISCDDLKNLKVFDRSSETNKLMRLK